MSTLNARYHKACEEICPAWSHCARCELATDALERHHPFKRGKGKAAWRMFVVIPLCRSCHAWVHDHENLAREHGWLIDPKRANPYDLPQ